MITRTLVSSKDYIYQITVIGIEYNGHKGNNTFTVPKGEITYQVEYSYGNTSPDTTIDLNDGGK